MAKQNPNVIYQWYFPEKYVEGWSVNGLIVILQFISSYNIKYYFFIEVFIL